MKKRHVIRLNGIKGVDLTSHPAEVSKTRASYMLNMISDGGLNRKRRGFHQIMELYGEGDRKARINGIHKFIRENGDEDVIIHAGVGIFNKEGKRIPSEVEITDTPSQLFTVGGRAYLTGCGGIYEYDGASVRSVIPYVPTVHKRYDYRLGADESYESPNILTEKRVCLYRGGSATEGDRGFFRLPEDMDLSKGATLYVEISSSKNDLRAKRGSDYAGTEDLRVPNPVTAVFDLTDGEAREISCRPISYNGMPVYVFERDASPSSREITLTLFWEKKSLFGLSFISSPETEGEFNMRLEYSSSNEGGIYSIGDCAFGELVQDNGGNTRLALSGNPVFGNGVYFSDSFKENGASYFPEECAVAVGDDAPVTALMKLSDTYVGVFKKNRFYRYAFYSYPNAKNPEEKIYVNGYEDRQRRGCINPFVCGKIGDDLMIFDGCGVYGIEEVSAETDKSFSSLRSINIEKALKGHSAEEKASAVACMHDGRYMLFLGGRIYIADTRYVFREMSRAEGYQYEWWVWEGPVASAVLSLGENLLIGDKDGCIYTQGGDYRDISIVRDTREGDALYQKDTGEFAIREEIPIDEDTYAIIDGYSPFLKRGDFSAITDTSTGLLKIEASSEAINKVMHGMNIRLEITGGSYVSAQIADACNEEYFLVADSCGRPITGVHPSNVEEIHIYRGNEELSLVRTEGGYSAYLGDEHIFFKDLGINPHIRLIKPKNVECVYTSPMLDLDCGNMTKTLYRIGISTSSRRSAGIKFGYETRKSVMGSADGIEGLDFASFDFDAFSFDAPFAKAFEKRVFERSFNYVMFKYASSENEDCAVRELYGVYSVNGSIKGVR